MPNSSGLILLSMWTRPRVRPSDVVEDLPQSNPPEFSLADMDSSCCLTHIAPEQLPSALPEMPRPSSTTLSWGMQLWTNDECIFIPCLILHLLYHYIFRVQQICISFFMPDLKVIPTRSASEIRDMTPPRPQRIPLEILSHEVDTTHGSKHRAVKTSQI